MQLNLSQKRAIQEFTNVLEVLEMIFRSIHQMFMSLLKSNAESEHRLSERLLRIKENSLISQFIERSMQQLSCWQPLLVFTIVILCVKGVHLSMN